MFFQEPRNPQHPTHDGEGRNVQIGCFLLPLAKNVVEAIVRHNRASSVKGSWICLDIKILDTSSNLSYLDIKINCITVAVVSS